MDQQQQSPPELLKLTGVDIEWAEQMLISCAKARSTLEHECYNGESSEVGQAALLNLKDEDVERFRNAIIKFSGTAKKWVFDCVVHMIPLVEKQKDITLPSFTVCGLGSFGREEMSPYSDCDLVILCSNEEDVKTVSEFAKYFGRATTLMRDWVPKLVGAASFSLTFELSSSVMTPSQLADTIPASESAIPDIFTIYDHKTAPNQFIGQFYKELATGGSLASLQRRVKASGLNAIIGGEAYAGFLWAKSSYYSIKNLIAFFQRALAVLSVVGNCAPQDHFLPAATSKRFPKFVHGQLLHQTELLYYQLVAIRFEMHFRFKEETDRITFSESQKTGHEKERVDSLRTNGLDIYLTQLNQLLKD